MNILIHDYGGYAFIVQLARHLARLGFIVDYAFSRDNVTPKGLLAAQPDDPESFSLTSLSLGQQLQKYDFLRRHRQEQAYGHLLARHIAGWKPDIVLCANTSIDAIPPAQSAARAIGARFVYWLQDIHWIAVRAALAPRLPVLGHIIAYRYRRLERRCLRNSDAVIMISEQFDEECDRAGVPPLDRFVIPNWAPIEDWSLRARDNPWARRHRLTDKFCFLYAGTLGLKHNPSMLLALVDHFADREDVRVIVASEGPGAEFLRSAVHKKARRNLILLSYQSFEEFPDMLATGDVLLAILESEAGTYSVPSKVLSYLCAGRPVLAALPLDNPAARLIDETGVGYVVPPSDIDLFLSSAENLLNDASARDSMGLAARHYAEIHFDIEQISDRFKALFDSVA